MTHTGITTIATYIATYNVPLVVLSIVIASIASYTALNLAGRVTVAQGSARKLWSVGGAIAMGVGIWSMHFIGMLAYELPIPMTYDIPTVLISMVAAVLASVLALFVVSRQKMEWLQLVLGSIFMGLGIASMHYIGMVATRVEAIAQYDPRMVGLSVAIAICVSAVALWLAFQLRTQTTMSVNVRKFASALIMGNAIAGMHYTGMAAVSFQPLPTDIQSGVVVQPSHAMGNSLLAFEIGLATLVILALAVLASFFDQRITAETARAETLRQSEERFRALVQNSSNVIAVIAADHTICYTSSSVKQILGYEAEEWFGSKAFEYVHLDDRAKVENLLTKALYCSATNITAELRLRHADNSWREFEVIANNFLAEPSVAGIVTTYRDITERKRAESALHESKKRLQEQNTALIQLAKQKTLHMGDLNAAVREITETATKTLGIERVSVWLYNDERSKIRCIDLYEWSVSRHSQGAELSAVDYPAYFQALKAECAIAADDAHTDPRTKEFSEFYFSPLGITSMLNAPIWQGGQMIGIVCNEHIGSVREWALEEQNFASSTADLVSLVIERKQAESEQQKLVYLIENSSDFVGIATLEGQSTYVNDAGQKLIGFEGIEEVRQTAISEYFTSEDLLTFKTQILPVAMEYGCWEGEFRFKHFKTGALIPIHFNFFTIKDRETGQPTAIATVSRDITLAKRLEKERKQAEADIRNALEKEKELGELKSGFVTMTSHEFRTPLATILSSTELLEHYSHKWTEERKLNHLQRIQVAVEHMTEMLNDVLLIGKAEAGKLEFEPTPLNLVQFCRSLVEDIQVSTDNHTIAFCSQGQCPNACMDEKLLRHILVNLLSNAIKYSPQGGTVHFDLVCQQGKVIFHIQDEGIGIPAVDQAQMFDTFYRASNVGTISGTGLGLAIVKKSVDLHAGTIIVASESGVGTTFRVTIPINNQLCTNRKAVP